MEVVYMQQSFVCRQTSRCMWRAGEQASFIGYKLSCIIKLYVFVVVMLLSAKPAKRGGASDFAHLKTCGDVHARMLSVAESRKSFC